MGSNWISDKLWRLAKVLYFLLSFLIIIFAFLVLISGDFFITKRYLSVTDYVPIYRAFDRWKLVYYIIYTILWYTLLTVIFWRIAHYIKTGSLRGNFNSSQIRRLLLFLWGIITLLIGAHFLSYKITDFCSGDHEIINQYESWDYRCDCSFWYKQRGSICIRASDQETFSGLNDGQIKRLLETVQLYTWDEKLQKMEEIYKQVIGPILFTNEYMTWWVEYTTWWLSIRHPWQISINENSFDPFKIYPNKNIYIEKTDFNWLVWHCIEWAWWREENPILKEQEQARQEDQYFSYIQQIKKGQFKEWTSRFDPYSCGQTKWPIKFEKITIDGINGVVIDYNATQDDSMDCITVFFKEVILVKSIDEIYKITFDYNFGRYGDMIIHGGLSSNDLTNKWSHYDWELCLYNKLDVEDWSVVKELEDYIKTWKWDVVLDFDRAMGVVNGMIKTIQIL